MATSNDEDSRQTVQYGDQQVERGHGGETHQVAAKGAPRLTTQQGTVVSDDQNTLRAGERGPSALAALPAARDFVTDAYAHCKFIGYTGDAAPLFEVAGLSRLMDDGFVSLDEVAAAEFVSRCGQLRFWSRQLSAVGV